MAKSITIPIMELAEGTRRVAEGDLADLLASMALAGEGGKLEVQSRRSSYSSYSSRYSRSRDNTALRGSNRSRSSSPPGRRLPAGARKPCSG